MKIKNKHWIGEIMVLEIIDDDKSYIGQLKTRNSKFIRAINQQELNKLTLKFVEDKKKDTSDSE